MDPVTLAIVGTAFTAVSAISQGNAARKEGEYNAAIGTRNAQIARDQADADASAQQRVAQQRLGAARASYAASGVTMEGSPLDVLAMSAANAEMDKQNILYKGNLRAMGYEETAALDLARGKNAQKQGYMKAASAFLTGGAKVYDSQPRAQTGYRIGDYEDPGY